MVSTDSDTSPHPSDADITLALAHMLTPEEEARVRIHLEVCNQCLSRSIELGVLAAVGLGAADWT